MHTARFRLGHAPDVGRVAGIPGLRPLLLQADVLTAKVADPQAALEELRKAGFPDAVLLPVA